MKKILHIQVTPKMSGVQRISLEIFRKLPDDEYDKWILFSDTVDSGDKQECRRLFESAGAKVIFSPKIKREIHAGDFAAIREIYKLCRREKFDIVHTHSTKPGIIGRIAASLARVPMVIHTVHGIAFHKFTPAPVRAFYWSYEMFASMFCDRIVMVNRYYHRYFRLFSRKLLTIYNGLDFSSLPRCEEETGRRSPVKILYVGRLDFQKDPLTLLAAARIVLNRYPDVRFTLVGDGEEYERCRIFIRDHGLGNNIELAGWRSDVSSYYCSHDIFAMSSIIYESFGLIFLEAGFYRLPVVATDVEGIPEVVKNGTTGLLCGPRDPYSLAMNIMELLSGDRFRKEMGEAGRERVLSLFDAATMASGYRDLYNGKNIKQG